MRRDHLGRFAGRGLVRQNGNGRGLQAQVAELIANTITSRTELIRQLIDPRRDINDECGYPATSSITGDMYRDMYDREPIATRVVNILPTESWSACPEVYEDEDPDIVTPFEEAWDNLSHSLRGASWYRGEKGNPIWEHLRRADQLSGIGTFGLLLLGIDDGKDLADAVDGIGEDGRPTSPALVPTANYDLYSGSPFLSQYDQQPGGLPKVQGKEPGRSLLFLRSFDQSLVQVTAYESSPSNPRFGQPIRYLVTFNDPREVTQGSAGAATQTKQVHWTRVIHLADNLGSSEIFGVPRMRPVFNRLCDLQKLYGGSAEMYWRGAFPGFSLETHPQLGGDVKVDKADMQAMMENYMNGLQRYLALMGMSAKSLAPQVVDPASQIDVQLTAICVQLGIPKRIFMGSERGELASSQDEGSWNDRLRDRQNGYITPRIIIPFIDRLIAIGVLPKPEEYTIVWPDVEALSDQEKASVAGARVTAMATYIQGGVEALITPLDFLTKELGYTDEEGKQILESATAEYEEKQLEEEQKQQEAFEQQQEAMKAAGTAPVQAPATAQQGAGTQKGAVPPQFQKKGEPKPTQNVFCKTGEGGGVDPSCGKGGEGAAKEGGGTIKKVSKYSSIKAGKMGKGAFVLPDGKLIDVTSDFGSGSNDHVGFFLTAGSKEIQKTLGISIKYSQEDLIDSIEEGDIEPWLEVQDAILDKGIVRVRSFVPEEAALQFNPSKVSTSRIVEYVEKGSLPKADRYVIDSTDFYGAATLSQIASASSWKDLEKVVNNEEEEVDEE